MKPVYQTKFGPKEGNCLAACVASIFHMTIEAVPDFPVDSTWWEAFEAWCRTKGFIPLRVEMADHTTIDHTGISIVSGASPRGEGYHAVVAVGGKMVHDPHPDGTGIAGDPIDYIFFTCDPGNTTTEHSQ